MVPADPYALIRWQAIGTLSPLRLAYCLFAGRILAVSQSVVGFSNCCGFPFLVIIRTPTTLPLYADCVLISGNILGALFIHVAPILVMAMSEGLEPPRRIIDEQVSNLRQYQLCLTHQLSTLFNCFAEFWLYRIIILLIIYLQRAKGAKLS